jgi:hypothetical protein
MPPDARAADTTAEARFAAALLDRDLPPPENLLGRDGGPVGRRFQIHRAGATLGLVGALAARHPVLEAMLGEDTFADLARAFLRVDRPKTALLLGWGDGLADFVAAHEDLAAWPYLADVARLEIAWAEAHHAADAEPIGRSALVDLGPRAVAGARLRRHPSLRLLASPHPVASLWFAHRDGGETDEITWRAEAVLVVRPHADVLVHRLTPAAHAFLAALLAGADTAGAADAASAVDPDFDAGRHLVGLVDLGAVVGFDTTADTETRP